MNLPSFKASLSSPVLARRWLTVALVALILVTRTNYSTAIIDTPDITLAAFFIAGLFILGPRSQSLLIFGILFGACVIADLLSFAAGVSDWCFTPAYVFLVPTYASLWYAGSLCRGVNFLKVGGAVKVVACFVVAVFVAYIISSYSFYYFSGRLSPSSALKYTQGLAHYFWHPYFSWAAAYTALAVGIAAVVRLTVSDTTKSAKP
jgi:hypothetical protein